jgi:streptomycin 6-kinase
MTGEFHVPAIVRRRALNLGDEGVAWLRGLDGDIAALAEEWGVSVGEVMGGGSEAFVAAATTEAGLATVLKVGVPGSGCGGHEADVMIAAEGRGYAQLLRRDEPRRAMLMEALGPRLDTVGLSVDAQMRMICETLKMAWLAPPGDTAWMNGAEKAESLAAFILDLWNFLDRPCSERVIERALAYAEERRDAFAPETAVLAHGDAHASNLLQAPGDPGLFKLIDPDGLFIEPAYDLAAIMRGWGAPLLAGDAVALGRERAQLLSRLTGVPAEPTWQWGFIERVSSGLLLKQLGEEAYATEYLAVAELWAAG